LVFQIIILLVPINARRLVFISTPLLIGVGGFANNNYWSSTENNNNNAWKQNFNNGKQNNNNKNNKYNVRVVRAFLETTLNLVTPSLTSPHALCCQLFRSFGIFPAGTG